LPATTSATRAASVAYALEEMASEPNTASALTLVSRSWLSSAEKSGLPMKAALRLSSPRPNRVAGAYDSAVATSRPLVLRKSLRYG
jgi:hypothetical protein